jgi:hypothetical protein
MEFVGSLPGYLQDAASGSWTELNLGLQAQSESDQNYWKKFQAGTARISVTYDHAPNVPSSLSTVPPTPCGTASNPTALNTPTPVFSARLKDADSAVVGDNVTGRLEIRDGATVVHGVDGAAVVANSVTSWPAVPAGRLPTNQPTKVFSYQAKATDSYPMASAFSSPCYFTVDTEIPGTPTVESTDFPDGEAVLAVGQTGTLTLSPGYGPLGLPDTDVSGYRYGFQQDKLTGWAPADGTGRATIPMVLWTTARALYVQAVDRAGNPSTSETPCICTAWDLRATTSGATPARKPADVTGDGLADVSTVLDMGYGRSAAWTFVRKASGGTYNPYVGWDTGVNGGFDGYRIKQVTGDFDRDGLADIAVFREDPDRRLRLFLLKSDSHRYDAAATPLWTEPTGGADWTLTGLQPGAGDADGDGDLDIVATVGLGNAEFTINVFRNMKTETGSVTFAAIAEEWYRNPVGWADPNRMKALVGDFNADGKADLAHFYNYDNCQTMLWIHYSRPGDPTRSYPAGALVWDGGVSNVCWHKLNPVAGYFTDDSTGRMTDIVGTYDYDGAYTRMWLWKAEPGNTVSTGAIWWDGISNGTAFQAPRAQLKVGDFNNDNRDDIAAVYDAAASTAKLHVFLTNATATGAVAPNLASPTWSGHLGAVPPTVNVEPGKRYQLVAAHSSKCLDVSGVSQADSARLQQYTCLGAAQTNQLWTLERIGGSDYYAVKAVHSGKCADVEGYNVDNGTFVSQYSCHYNGNQQWRLEYLAGNGLDAQARIRPAHSDKCLDVYAANTADTAAVVQWDCLNGPGSNQSWYVRLIS